MFEVLFLKLKGTKLTLLATLIGLELVQFASKRFFMLLFTALFIAFFALKCELGIAFSFFT